MTLSASYFSLGLAARHLNPCCSRPDSSSDVRQPCRSYVNAKLHGLCCLVTCDTLVLLERGLIDLVYTLFPLRIFSSIRALPQRSSGRYSSKLSTWQL